MCSAVSTSILGDWKNLLDSHSSVFERLSLETHTKSLGVSYRRIYAREKKRGRNEKNPSEEYVCDKMVTFDFLFCLMMPFPFSNYPLSLVETATTDICIYILKILICFYFFNIFLSLKNKQIFA